MWLSLLKGWQWQSIAADTIVGIISQCFLLPAEFLFVSFFPFRHIMQIDSE